ncbi:MAG: amidase [Chromatiales bacterium]|nr:amidase [Chromatiales bacterium]
MDIAFRTAVALVEALRDKEIGSLELLDHFHARMERHNPALGAIVFTDMDAARARAREADSALARGESWGPLHGLPMTVKESYDVVGMPTTWGVPALADNIATTNALSVQRLIDAGAIVFGKTNVPIHLADWQSYNAIYGTTNNPWDLTRTPGGSSGGSAAALATGLTGLEAGSDIGASIRNPAHYCGVYGHKPTYGIVPPRGQALPGVVAPTDISVVGPMARGAEDLAVALDVMAGPDPIEAAGWKLDLRPPRRARLDQYRVALVLEDPCAEVDVEVQERLQAMADFLRGAGATVVEGARPAFSSQEANEVYTMLLRAATSRRLSDEAFAANVELARSVDPNDPSYAARMVRAQVMAHRDWLGYNERRHRMRLQWAAFFEDHDLMLCPAASSTAFPHDHAGERHERTVVVNNKKVLTTDQMFWAGYSGFAYLPSTVAPAGLTPHGLPVGVQIIGPQYGDRECIAFAALLEREYQGFVAPPGYDP